MVQEMGCGREQGRMCRKGFRMFHNTEMEVKKYYVGMKKTVKVESLLFEYLKFDQ